MFGQSSGFGPPGSGYVRVWRSSGPWHRAESAGSSEKTQTIVRKNQAGASRKQESKRDFPAKKPNIFIFLFEYETLFM
jgi:hypothetical protein